MEKLFCTVVVPVTIGSEAREYAVENDNCSAGVRVPSEEAYIFAPVSALWRYRSSWRSLPRLMNCLYASYKISCSVGAVFNAACEHLGNKNIRYQPHIPPFRVQVKHRTINTTRRLSAVLLSVTIPVACKTLQKAVTERLHRKREGPNAKTFREGGTVKVERDPVSCAFHL